MMDKIYARKQLPYRRTESFAVLHLGQHRSFLNETGSKIWELVDGRKSTAEISRDLAAELNLSDSMAGRVAPKVESFLDVLYRSGFLWVVKEGQYNGPTVSTQVLKPKPERADGANPSSSGAAERTLHAVQEVCMTPKESINNPATIEDRIQKLYWEKNYIQKMHLELTYRCNFRCAHCYNTTHGGGTSELTTGQWKAALDDLAALGCWLVTFTGGEAFVRKDIIELLQYSCEKGFSININTNGSLIDEKVVSFLEPLRPFIQSIDISIYGADAFSHDTLSSSPGSFYITRRTLRLLRDAKLPVLAKFITMRDNFDGVDKFEDEMRKLKIPYNVSTGALIPQTDRKTKPLVQLLTDDQYKKLMSTRTTHGFSNSGTCRPGHVRGAITPDGSVSPCEWLTDIKYGSLKEQSLKEIWYSQGFLAFRRRFEEEQSECPSCELRPGCGRCPAHSYLETGDIFKCAPIQRHNAEICREIGVVEI
jgi:radical SAM protein with 4Fe4S-binding SPASM domain